MVSNFLANIIYFIHILAILLIFFGNFFISKKYLPLLAIFIISIMINWAVDDTCILTKLENYFRTGKWISKSAAEENAPEFFRPFVYKITGIQLKRKTASKVNQILFLMILLITLFRIFISQLKCK